MKRHICLLVVLLFTAMAFSQTQQGFVKTKGRMVNGQLMPGQGLKGATVTVKGSTPVIVKSDDGAFSFPIPAQTFMVQSVQKNGFELVDADAIRMPYSYSSNPIYLVMETPEQQMQDQLDSERKIRRTLQRQLQQREDEIEALKEAQKITIEEYQQALQKLYADQENNEKLIADMAKQYARMDYDQMDELNQRISDAILNGRLTEADSLLRSKGDINERIASIRKAQQAEAKREDEIAREQAELAISKAGTQKQLEDVAEDCYKYYNLCQLHLDFDSAAYYIMLRAELDTTNLDWQDETCLFLSKQNRFGEAIKYATRTLGIIRDLERADSALYESSEAIVLNSLAVLYANNNQFAESEAVYEKCLELWRHVAEQDHQSHAADLAVVLNNFGSFYHKTGAYKEAAALYQEALDILGDLTKDYDLGQVNQQPNDMYSLLGGPFVGLGMTLGNLASIYMEIQQFEESERCYKEALEIYRHLAAANPIEYEPELSQAMQNLAIVYEKTNQFQESEALFMEALEIQRRLANDNPQAYQPKLALTLLNLGNLYCFMERWSKGEAAYQEALEIWRRFAQFNPQVYEPELATVLSNLGMLYDSSERYIESENCLLDAMKIRLRLAKENPQVYEPDLAVSFSTLSLLYQEIELWSESEYYNKAAIDLYRHLAKGNPQVYEHFLISMLKQLAFLYLDQDNLLAAIPMFEEVVSIYQTDSSAVGEYMATLMLLNPLYTKAQNHGSAYQINQELLPFLENGYRKGYFVDEYVEVLGSHAFNCLFLEKFFEAEEMALEALSIAPDQHWIVTNLAAAQLFQGKYTEAEQLYRQYKDELKEDFLNDFNTFETAGVIPGERKADVEKIRKLLSE